MALLSIHLLTELRMARPIKETPILTGKDAGLFLKTVAEMEAVKMSKEEVDKINSSFERIVALMQAGCTNKSCYIVSRSSKLTKAYLSLLSG